MQVAGKEQHDGKVDNLGQVGEGEVGGGGTDHVDSLGAVANDGLVVTDVLGNCKSVMFALWIGKERKKSNNEGGGTVPKSRGKRRPM